MPRLTPQGRRSDAEVRERGGIVDPSGRSRATESLPDDVRGFDRGTEKQRRYASDLGTLLLDRSGTRESCRSPDCKGTRLV